MSSKAPVTIVPKPCLKQTFGTAFNAQEAKHAHFPPPSQECKRYSGIEYDRTPIVVYENDLALPARGCPGRTFDQIDAHHYRHHSKKHCKSDKSSNGDHVHPSYIVATGSGLNIPMELAHSQLLASTAGMPSLSTIHGDTSESDGDSSPSMSGIDGGMPYLTSSVSMTRGTQPRRLRKANATDRQRVAGTRLQRTNGLESSSPTSTFASCPGSNSCLGGF